ncbi:MAG: hypothetical protein HQL29_02420 [Candidatus Omnitrophica bacterium]|nr:hypothetical protein [Candidatus Omnitrophota bacterium]
MPCLKGNEVYSLMTEKKYVNEAEHIIGDVGKGGKVDLKWNMLITIFVSIPLFFIFLMILAPDFYRDVKKLFKEVDTTFTLEGKPLHPKLIWEFEPWLSDGSPSTIVVDVLAAKGSNEYYEDDIITEEGIHSYKAEDNTTFTYKWLGRLNNGLHVLRTADWGGGSGVFISLILVKFDLDSGLDGYLHSDDFLKYYDRILMSVVLNYSLEDRYEGEIKIIPKENKVIVQKEDKEKILDFNYC